ncbi:hypothetical protein BACOVA_05320 [Bacteroides ovatus ATCC 8483]|uniref:Uncharacterized protein n=1 Tax=Bacteroides ovatus (strain ATCC 8483 / DSM 1896 / JCM 5824 / BCRC 10623 / CCUG 4943 / NCTC 11153) TaxID=411476 RepID=A0AAN3A491_BACO1|nr:hypothetical protein BACOVA_05320 [Bacteroides ovatus ATCC 8483]
MGSVYLYVMGISYQHLIIRDTQYISLIICNKVSLSCLRFFISIFSQSISLFFEEINSSTTSLGK